MDAFAENSTMYWANSPDFVRDDDTSDCFSAAAGLRAGLPLALLLLMGLLLALFTPVVLVHPSHSILLILCFEFSKRLKFRHSSLFLVLNLL